MLFVRSVTANLEIGNQFLHIMIEDVFVIFGSVQKKTSAFANKDRVFLCSRVATKCREVLWKETWFSKSKSAKEAVVFQRQVQIEKMSISRICMIVAEFKLELLAVDLVQSSFKIIKLGDRTSPKNQAIIDVAEKGV